MNAQSMSGGGGSGTVLRVILVEHEPHGDAALLRRRERSEERVARARVEA